MGFGLLLVGYFFVSVVSLYSPLSVAMLFGYPMMMLGLWRLAPYQKIFRTAFYFSFVSLPFAFYYALFALTQWGIADLSLATGGFYQTVEWMYFLFALFFTLLWLYGIFSLCRELGLAKLQAPALRAILLFGAMYALDLISRLPIDWIAGHRAIFVIPALFMRIVTVFLNVYLLYGCYRYIAPEGEMPIDNTDPAEKALEELTRKNKKGGK